MKKAGRRTECTAPQGGRVVRDIGEETGASDAGARCILSQG